MSAPAVVLLLVLIVPAISDSIETEKVSRDAKLASKEQRKCGAVCSAWCELSDYGLSVQMAYTVQLQHPTWHPCLTKL